MASLVGTRYRSTRGKTVVEVTSVTRDAVLAIVVESPKSSEVGNEYGWTLGGFLRTYRPEVANA